MSPRTFVLISVAFALAAGRADADPTYGEARAAWLACFPKDAPVDVPALGDDGLLKIAVTRIGPRVRIAWHDGGSGSEAVYSGATIELDAKTCAALWERDATYDGAFVLRVRIGWTKRGAPTERELAALVAAPAHTEQPAFAMGRAWLDHDCDGGPDSTLAWAPGKLVAGPIAPTQPWFHGEPVKSQASFWSVAAQRSIAARTSLLPHDDDELLPPRTQDKLLGVVVPGLHAPAVTFTVGTIEIREAALLGRNDGRAIALYDRAANRHRWVLLTRGCVQGSTVAWLGAIGTRAIGVTASQHDRYARGDAIVVVDTAAGTASAIALPDAVAKGDVERTTAKLAGTTVTFGAGAATATLDLAPALAELPR